MSEATGERPDRERRRGGPDAVRRARFALPELHEVLGRFDLGAIRKATEYRAGSRRAPKLLLETERGRFLLKRRSLARHALPRIRFGQSLQATLAACGFPVAPLVPSRDVGGEGGETLVVREQYAYEVFRFVAGERFDRSVAETTRAGACAARLHQALAGCADEGLEPASFHRSEPVTVALRVAEASIAAVGGFAGRDDRAEAVRTLGELAAAYGEAMARVESLGFGRLGVVTIHGDWHPGNLLFAGGEVAAVIDFDSARHEPRVIEVANGMLQFAALSRRGVSPLGWPRELDPARLAAFRAGYDGAAERPLEAAERSMLPWLMIEAMVAESIVPIANTGSFADLPAVPFLAHVLERCRWVRARAGEIAAA